MSKINRAASRSVASVVYRPLDLLVTGNFMLARRTGNRRGDLVAARASLCVTRRCIEDDAGPETGGGAVARNR